MQLLLFLVRLLYNLAVNQAEKEKTTNFVSTLSLYLVLLSKFFITHDSFHRKNHWYDIVT